MTNVQMVRALVNQRLTAAAEEIFGLFERTIAEHEEELCRLKEKNERQQKLLDAVLKPEVRLHRADIQQLVVVKEEVPPEQQEWSPSLDQEDPPEPPHIKEEQEELWTSQEGEQLQGLEEADITKFPFTPVPVKSEDDEEKPQSSQLHQRQTEQMETGADGEDCGGPEPARNLHPDPHLQPQTEDSEDWNDTTEHESSVHLGKKPFSYSKCGKRFCRRLILKRHMRTHTGEKLISCSVRGKSSTQTGSLTRHTSFNTGDRRFNCSVCNKRFTQSTDVKCVGPQSSQLHQQDKTEDSSDTEGSDEWSKDIREPPSDSKSLNNNEVSKNGVRFNIRENPLSCSLCGKAFTWKKHFKRHMTVHKAEKRFSCPVCEKRFKQKGDMKVHMALHTGEKPFQCSVCQKAFAQKCNLKRHMTVHTGEKRFSCSVCEKHFKRNSNLTKHMTMHTGDKAFKCAVCAKGFKGKRNLAQHMAVHTVEKRLSCSVCGKTFTWDTSLRKHMFVHSAEKPFQCSVCAKGFIQKDHLTTHMVMHTGEKPFKCSVCGKAFTQKGTLTKHMAIHTGEKRFSCSVCDQRFTSYSQLRNHKRVCPQSSQLHQTEQNREAEPGASSSTEQMETGADGKDCGGPEPARNSHPDL